MKYKNITTSVVMGLALLALSGCKSLYGKYERPDVKTEGLVRDVVSDRDTLAVTDTASFANVPWRSVFTDARLQALIEQGLAQNPDLLNAALNVKMTQAQLLSAKLAFIPAFSFTPQGTISSWDGNKGSQVYSLPVNASWMIDLFGNLLSVKRSAQMSLLQMRDYQLSVQTSLVAGIANMYYTLLMLDRQLQIVDEMEALTKKTWEQMKVFKETRQGYYSTAVQTTESNYYSVLTQKTDLKRQIREVENSLSLLIGQQAQTIARGTLEAQQLPEKWSTGVGIQLLANRPDVHAAEMSLAQCFYGVQTARSRFYPSITISGTGAFTNNGGGGIVNPGKWLLSAVGSLTQPIFQNGRLIAGLKVAKAQYEQAYNTWQNAILMAGSEVSNALVLYNASAEKSAIEAKQIEVLKDNVASTLEMMESKNATYLEVIQAQSSLLNVQLSKVVDDFSKMQAVVNLYQALGGGVK